MRARSLTFLFSLVCACLTTASCRTAPGVGSGPGPVATPAGTPAGQGSGTVLSADVPPAAALPAAAPTASLPDAGADSVPLEPDPGPAASRPLHPRFATLPETGGWLRLLVDLREQVDLGALMRSHDAQALPRSARRARTLSALSAVAERGRARVEPLLERLVSEGKADYYRQVRFRNRYFVAAKRSALPELRAEPAIAELIPEYDSVREARAGAGRALSAAPPVPPGDSWAIEALGLRDLWKQGVDGRGVVVGILDSGVFGDHLALAAGRRGAPDWFDAATGRPDPVDTVPHGSQVLSCAVGREAEGRALGAAPGATWVAALSNLYNSYNNVNMSLAADWLLFEARPDVLLGAWGHGPKSCYAHDGAMLEAFRAAGIVAVFAAGNDGPGAATGETPAALDPAARGGALAVAASDRHGKVIDASSRGPNRCGTRPFPDLAAPGWDVPVPTAPYPNSLTVVSGTSFSVGFVGGVAALILQLQPEMPVADVEEILRRTARDLPPAGHDDVSGHGLLDPRAAVEAARAWRPPAPR